MPIMRVRDMDETVVLANQTSYGLAANVGTQDKRNGSAQAKRLVAGSVCINDMTMTYGAPEASFGGRKFSGIGQVNGVSGLRGYTHPSRS